MRVIQDVRDRLAELTWENADLLLAEFGFGERQEDPWGNGPSLGDMLRAGNEDDLIELAHHLSVDVPEDAVPVRVATDERRPLLVFASHQSKYKALVDRVSQATAKYGVQLFVAHTSIEPDQEWRDEIVRVLGVADAGVAFLHKEFKPSDWCDQEVGWLLGRRVPVLSLKFDMTPYGPLGDRQAIDATNLSEQQIAEAILDVLAKRTELRHGLASSLVEGMNSSLNFKTTDNIWFRLRELDDLDADQCGRLADALEQNNQVYWADSPWDKQRPYLNLVSEFITRQPGGPAVNSRVQEIVDLRTR